MAAYHAIADTKISPMFIAYDDAASAVVKALQQHAVDQQASAQSNISLMTTLIIAVTALALLLVVGIRFALRGLIVQPLADATACFERIAAGDLSETDQRIQPQRNRAPVRAASSGCRTACRRW